MGRSHARNWASTRACRSCHGFRYQRRIRREICGRVGTSPTHTIPISVKCARKRTWTSSVSRRGRASALNRRSPLQKVVYSALLPKKPMSASVGDAQDMMDACDKHNVKLVVGHQRRFSPQNCEARRALSKKAQSVNRRRCSVVTDMDC